MTIGTAGFGLSSQSLGSVALGTSEPFLVMNVFVEVVEIDPVFLWREMPFGCERGAVAAVVVFGEAAVVFAADVALVVAALAPLG